MHLQKWWTHVHHFCKSSLNTCSSQPVLRFLISISRSSNASSLQENESCREIPSRQIIAVAVWRLMHFCKEFLAFSKGLRVVLQGLNKILNFHQYLRRYPRKPSKNASLEPVGTRSGQLAWVSRGTFCTMCSLIVCVNSQINKQSLFRMLLASVVTGPIHTKLRDTKRND